MENKIDTLIICPFTRRIREMKAEEFIEKILVQQLHASYIAVGTDFHFGHPEAGRHSYAAALCKAVWITAGSGRESSVSKPGNQQLLRTFGRRWETGM